MWLQKCAPQLLYIRSNAKLIYTGRLYFITYK